MEELENKVVITFEKFLDDIFENANGPNFNIFNKIYDEINNPNSTVKITLNDIMDTSEFNLPDEEKFNLLINQRINNSIEDIEQIDLRINSGIFLKRPFVKILCFNTLKYMFENYIIGKLKEINSDDEYINIIECFYKMMKKQYELFSHCVYAHVDKSNVIDGLHKTILAIKTELDVQNTSYLDTKTEYEILTARYNPKNSIYIPAIKIVTMMYSLIYNDVYISSRLRDACKEFVKTDIVISGPFNMNRIAYIERETNSIMEDIYKLKIKDVKEMMSTQELNK